MQRWLWFCRQANLLQRFTGHQTGRDAGQGLTGGLGHEWHRAGRPRIGFDDVNYFFPVGVPLNGELEVDQSLHFQCQGQSPTPVPDRAEGALPERNRGKAAGGITGVDARRFDVLHQAPDHHVALVVAEGIDVYLNGILQVLVDQYRMVGFHLNRLHHVAIQLLFVEDHLHGATTQHIGRADHHRIAHAGRHIPGFRLTAGQAMPRLANLQLAQDRFELLAIFSTVDRLR